MTNEYALAFIRDLSPAEITALVQSTLLGREPLPKSGGWNDERPEEIFSRILQSKDLLPEIRAAIITGCKAVYTHLDSAVDSGNMDDHVETNLRDAFVRLGCLVEIAKPNELRARTKAFLQLLLELEGVPSEMLVTATEAWMTYSQSVVDAPLWEEVINRPELAAYAYTALLSIDANHPRIETHLVQLWRKQIKDKWPLDTAFLMKRTLSKRASAEVVAAVLGRIEIEEPSLIGFVREELKKRPWSCGWALAATSIQVGQLATFAVHRRPAKRPSLAEPRLRLTKPYSPMEPIYLATKFHKVSWTGFQMPSKNQILQGVVTATDVIDVAQQDLNRDLIEDLIRMLAPQGLLKEL